MRWFRHYSRQIFGPYLSRMGTKEVEKYLAVSRLLYFFSATSLGILFWHAYNKFEKEKVSEESGLPVIKDRSPAHETLRNKGVSSGVVYTYVPGKGMVREEYNKDLYLQELEKEAFERAKAAQEKAIKEGKQLDPDAIKLVK